MKTASEDKPLVKKKRQKRVRTELKRKKGKKATRIKLEAKPLTEEQIQFFLKYYKENNSFPGSKIPCNMTGKLTTCVGPWMAKKIKEYGSAENLLRKYKCRGALKRQRDALKPAKTRKPRNKKRQEIINSMKNTDTEQKVWDLPKIAFSGPQPMTESDLAETTKGACLRPDIYLNNDGHCNGCKYVDLCQNRLKNIKKIKSKK